jgi:hypothetical protein
LNDVKIDFRLSYEIVLIKVFATTYMSSSQFVKPLSRELRKEIKVRSAIKEMEITT